MNFVVSKPALAEELGYVMSSYSLGPRPVVTLEYTDNNLHLSTEDGRRYIESALEVEGQPGKLRLTILGDTVLDYLALIKDKTVTLSISDKTLQVQHSAGSMTVNATTLPTIQRAHHDESKFIGEFRREDVEVLNGAAAFASIKRAHDYISGTLLQSQDGKLRMVASDNYLVAVVEISPAEPVKDATFVIPPEALIQMQRMIRGTKADMVVLEQRASSFIGRCNSRMFTMGLSAGRFPMTYERVFPKVFTHEITVDAPTLLDVVRRAIILHGDKDKAIKLIFSGHDLTIETPGSKESMQVLAGHADVEIKIDGPYLRGVLENTPAPQVAICIVDPTKPFTFVPAWPNGQAKYLITPRTK